MPVVFREVNANQGNWTISNSQGIDYRSIAPDLLDEETASRFLGVSVATLRKAIEEQGLPCKVIGDKKRLFSKRLIMQWIES